jgi:hypothetical protein
MEKTATFICNKSEKLLLAYIPVLLLLSMFVSSANGQSFNLSFEGHVVCESPGCEEFDVTLSGVQFDFIFTDDGVGGSFLWVNVAGEDNKASMDVESNEPNQAQTERFLINRNDGEPFVFTSIYLNNVGSEDVIAQGFLNGSSVGSPVTVSNGEDGVYNFGDITVDEIQFESTDFFQFSFDSFRGDISVPSDPPTVTTAPPTSIGTTSATLGGNVTNDGGADVFDRGIVYSTNLNPTTDDNVVQIGSGTGSFSQNVTGLSPGTTYYVRAYATNSEGTSYGSEESFTTSVEVESIVRHDPTSELTNSDQVVFEVNLSGPVDGLSSSNFSVESSELSGVSWGGISGNGSTYEVTINTGSDDGSLRLDLENSSGVSPTITELPYTAGQSYTIDKTPPTVTISSTETSPTNADPITVDIDFSESVSTFVIGDIIVTGGTSSNFSGSGANYTVDVTPSGDGTITVDVPAGVAQDDAGNDNTAATQFSIVSDRTAPTVAITSDETSPTNADSFLVSINFSENVSGFDINNLHGLHVTGGEITGFGGTSGGSSYIISIRPDGDGTITVDLDAGVAQDAAGNDNIAAPQFSIVSNISEPTVSITSTESNPTNAGTIPLEIEFSEDVTGFVVGDIDVSGGVLSNFSGSGANYTVDVTPSADGTITVDVPAGVAQDAAGNDNEAAPQFSILSDQTAPEITSFTAQQSSPTNETDLLFDLVFSEEVGVPAEEDFEITNGSFHLVISDDGNNATWMLVVNPDDEESEVTIEVEVLQNGVQDLAGNSLDNSATASVDYDGVAPSPVISTTAPANTSPIPVEIDFGEPVIDFTQSLAEDAISAANGTGFSIEDFEADAEDEVFTFNLIPDADDTFTIELAQGIVSDRAGNENQVSNELVVAFNTSRPEITFRAVEEGGQITDDELDSPTNADFFTLFIDFGEQLESFALSDIDSNNASLDDLQTVNLGEGVYEVRVEPDGDGEITITIADGAVQDLAGNDNEEGQFQITSDRTAPTITSIARGSGIDDPTNQSPFDIEITFSEEISDFDESELSVSNGNATDFSTTDNITFTVEVTPDAVTTSSNTLEIGVPAGIFTDPAGNENEADSENFTIEFGDTRPTAALTSSEPDPTNADDIEVMLNVTEIFGEPVTSITAADFTITRANITNIDDTSNPEFVLTIEPQEEGEISIQLNENVLTDVAGNQNEASNEFTIIYDVSPPVVSIAATESDPTNADEFEVTITFTKPVFNFEQSDIVAGNAQLSGFTGNDGDTGYMVMVAPDGDGLVTIDVPMGSAQDIVGNDNTEADTFEITSDRTAPTIASIARSSGLSDPTNESPFDIVITFSEEIADFDESELSVTSGSATGFSSADNIEFTVTIEPDDVTTSSNTLEIGVPAGSFTDLAGNENEADSENFTIEFGDTRPTAEWTTTVNDPTFESPVRVTLSVTEIFGQPVAFSVDDIITEHVSSVTIAEDNNPVFELDVVPDGDGPFDLSLILDEGDLTDIAGNSNDEPVVFSITFDNNPPTAGITSPEPDPTNSDAIPVTFTFSKPVFGFSAADVEITNAAISNVEGSDGDEVFTADLLPEEDGLVTLTIPEGVATDRAGNENEVSDPFEILSDRTPPRVVSIEAEHGLSDPTNQGRFDLIVTFSEPLTDLDEEQIASENAAITGITSDDQTVFTVTMEPAEDGPVSLSVEAGFGTDEAGNESEAAAEPFEILFDGTPPLVTLTSEEGDLTNADSFEVMLSFSKPVIGLELNGITADNAKLSGLEQSDSETWTVVVSPQEDGLVSIGVREGAVSDEAGNENPETEEPLEIHSDRTPPTAEFSTGADDPVFDPVFEVLLTFSKPVSGLELSDFESDNAGLSDFEKQAPDSYTFVVQPEKDGRVTVTLPQGAVSDAAGNGNEPAEFEITYDTSPARVELISPDEGASYLQVMPEFTWEPADRADAYELQVATGQDFRDEEVVKDITGIEQVAYQGQTGLAYETVHYWRVRGSNSGVAGEWSQVRSFTTIIAPPPAVVLIAPEDGAEGVDRSPVFEWEPAERAEEYIFELFEAENTDQPLLSEQLEETSFTPDEPIAFDREFTWRVRGINPGGNGDWSPWRTFHTPVEVPGLVVLRSPEAGSGSVPAEPILEWEAAERAEEYRLEISRKSHFEQTVISVEGITQTSHQISEELDYFREYFWRVAAENSGGAGQWSEPGHFVTEAEKPVAEFPAADSQTISIAPHISWISAHEGALMEVQLTGDPESEAFVVNATTEESFYQVTGLEPDQQYFWRVRVTGDITRSSWTDWAGFTTRPDPDQNQQISHRFEFPAGSEGEILSEDYRLIGLPGQHPRYLDEIFKGRYGDDWRAFTDDGSQEDFLIEFEPDQNRLQFGQGSGYWAYNREAIDVDELLGSIDFDESDAVAIGVQPGWNIISNPYPQQIEWNFVLTFNEIEADLYRYDQLFLPSAVMEPFEGYYFFNHPEWELDELWIPFGEISNREDTSGDEDAAEHSRIDLIASYGQGDGDLENPPVLSIYFDGGDAPELESPYPSLSHAAYGMAWEGEEHSLSRSLRAFSADYHAESEGRTLMIKSPHSRRIALQVEFHNTADDAAILLISPEGQSQLVSADQMADLNASPGKTAYTVIAGSLHDLEEYQQSLLPEGITLEQNYPNPFNPQTMIRYTLTEQVHVNLEVYDMLGRRVQTLVNESQSPGWHTVEFDGSQLSSGMYLYRLVAGEQMKTGRMTLVK